MTAENFYNRMQRQATKLISEFGYRKIPAKWRKIENVMSDDGTEAITQREKEYTCHVVLFPRNLLGRKKVSNIENEQRGGEIKALLAVSDEFTPNGKDFLIANGETYRILTIDPLQPADKVLMYKLELQV